MADQPVRKKEKKGSWRSRRGSGPDPDPGLLFSLLNRGPTTIPAREDADFFLNSRGLVTPPDTDSDLHDRSTPLGLSHLCPSALSRCPVFRLNLNPSVTFCVALQMSPSTRLAKRCRGLPPYDLRSRIGKNWIRAIACCNGVVPGMSVERGVCRLLELFDFPTKLDPIQHFGKYHTCFKCCWSDCNPRRRGKCNHHCRQRRQL
jgi:hypothetical protein